MKFVVLTDIHFSYQSADSERRGDIADILLLRAVHRINRFVKPDLVLLLGDIINEPDSLDAVEQYHKIKGILDILDMPYIILHGNHDIEEDEFYRIFDRPNDITDVGNVRFVCFIDPEQPGYNAVREEHNLNRMRAVRNDGFDGFVVALQHVPIFPPGTRECPYNYTNADEIIDIMKRYKIDLAISGHFHDGFELLKTESGAFLAVSALCEQPFRFAELDIDNNTGEISVINHQLTMPKELSLIDHHIHTHFAYCNENMDVDKAQILARAFNLAEVRFSEHSSHLYWNRQDYANGIFYRQGMQAAKPQDFRIEQYLSLLEKSNCPKRCIGLEVDCDWTGELIIRNQDASRTGFLIGAIHSLPTYESAEVKNAFLTLNKKILQTGIKILAHPFRIFRRAHLPTPPELFEPMVKLLKQNNVAAELNFHTNYPSADFVSMCIESGVKLSLGSDAHNLYEVGEFYPHLALLSKCGISQLDINHILIS